MADKRIPMSQRKQIALVAHDNKKRDLVEWAKFNRNVLAEHRLYAQRVPEENHEINFPF